LLDVVAKHKANEKFLYVCSENQQDNEIVNWLKASQCEFTLGFMYRSVSCDIKPLFAKKSYDLICFFTPSGIRSLFDSFPNFAQQELLIGAFGSNTIRAVEESGLKLSIAAPAPKAPSMVAALDQYLGARQSKK
jgi:uroporphyrinogen-III synthase